MSYRFRPWRSCRTVYTVFLTDPEFQEFTSRLFVEQVQTLEIKTDDQEGLLYGELGRNIKAAPFYSCWDADAGTYEDNCLYWKNKAYLRVAHDDNVTSSCYTLRWQGLQAGFVAEDCFYLQKFNWYGYLVPDQQFWPVRGVQVGLPWDASCVL